MPTADLRRRLVELDAKIIEQEAVLDALKSDRSAVRQELEDTSTFPILTLPVEITTEIFIWCLPTIEELREDHVSRSDGEPAEPHAPLTLASCCRLWRAIALGTPFLWATFPLFLKHHSITNPGREDLAAFIHRWLGRAATGPLTFVFHTPPPQPYPYHGDNSHIKASLHCVRDTLDRYASRLKFLDLVANDLDLPNLLTLNSLDFPLLQRIVMGVDRNEPEPWPHRGEKTFREAPKFCELLLRDSGLLSSYSLPLTRLTRFEGGIDDLQLFQLAPNLVEAKCCFHWTYSTPRFETDITHSGLRSLTLSSSNPVYFGEYITDILGRLTLPALLSLDLPDDAPTDAAALHSLLYRSNPPLKSLAIQVNIDDVEDDGEHPFVQYGASFSLVAATLEKLDIHSPSPAFMSRIWHRGSLLPQLKALALLSCPPVDYKTVLAFLYRRSSSPASATLESFQLRYSDGIVFDDKRFTVPEAGGTPRTIEGHMRELESNGTRIQIGSSTRDLFKSKI
ncbi:hypothetical protein C8R46DRAFT_681355 [Mycena filopes]|nr:hypothetical protein C8R46DRAFT_681355 [Mycena filopes]